MSRVISVESTSKQRNTLLRGIVAALRQLILQKQVDAHSIDLVAYIGLSLLAVSDNIDQTVLAWEKRGYWVKADRFRMEWSWTAQLGKDLLQALDRNDWAVIAAISAKTGQKLAKVKVTDRSRIGTPWIGAMAQYQKKRTN